MSQTCTVLVIVLGLTTGLRACGGGSHDIEEGYYEEGDGEENESMELDEEWLAYNASKKGKDSLKSNLWHHGWTPSPIEQQQWRDWLNDYKAEFNQSAIDIAKPENLHEFDHERGPGSGWPMRWADSGVGMGGGAAPPWAYAPKNTGKPRFCFLPPRIGVCSPPDGVDPYYYTPPKPSIRYAYHPYKDQCISFTFSGCSGNRNNFSTKIQCEERCVMPIPFNGCDVESHIYIDDAVGANTQ